MSMRQHVGGMALASVSAIIGLTLGFPLVAWLPSCIGAYGLAWFFIPAPSTRAIGTYQSGINWTTEQAIAWLQTAKEDLPAEHQKVLGYTLDKISFIAPKLRELETAGGVDSGNRTQFKLTIKKHLPDIVASYLRFPAHIAKMPLANGRTPNDLFLEQLQMVASHMEEVERGFWSNEVNGLLANERFLQEKLQLHQGLFDETATQKSHVSPALKVK